MILERDIFLWINIDVCFSDNTSKINGVAYKGCTSPYKENSKIYFNLSPDWIKEKYYGMKNYGIINMWWTQCGVHVTS